jgi:hypothetical protein
MRFFRSWNDRSWTAWIWAALVEESRSSRCSMPSSSCWTAVKVAVDEVVEQAVEQERDAMFSEVGPGVPAGEHRCDVEPVVLADGDKCLFGHEHRDLVGVQPRRGRG